MNNSTNDKVAILGDKMDVFKKKNQIIDNKTAINSAKPSVNDYIVYFLNASDDIVYIGRKKGTSDDIISYVAERYVKYFAVSYWAEAIVDENPDDAHAERVLTLEPIFNKFVPNNTKFISVNQAKQNYRMGKREFGQLAKQHGSFTFGAMSYILKSVFDDVVGMSQPYAKNMPKEGYGIVLITDELFGNELSLDNFWSNFFYDKEQEMDKGFDEDGNRYTTITEKWMSIEELHEKLLHALKNKWTVSRIIDYHTFEAIADKDRQKRIFSSEDCGNEWVKAPDFVQVNDIINRYAKSKQI